MNFYNTPLNHPRTNEVLKHNVSSGTIQKGASF